MKTTSADIVTSVARIVFRGPLRTRLQHLTVALLVLICSALLIPGTVSASVPMCSNSTGPSGAYSVVVCIDAPTDGATVSGLVTIETTVTVIAANPGIQKLIFYLNGDYLITDWVDSYSFVLPTTYFVDGSYQLSVEAIMRDGYKTNRAMETVSFSNGITTPPTPASSFVPTTGGALAGSAVLAVVGDGASGEPNAGAVTDLMVSWSPDAVLYLGDVYDKGTLTEFYNWYGTTDTFYGRMRDVTNPVVGNHEYGDGGAQGYFGYWNSPPHYYSYDLNGWHFIALDSTSQYNQTSTNSAQYQWLVQDLDSNNAACTVAYFHHPRFSVGPQGDTDRLAAIWSLLAQHGVDIVLTGHDHQYQRWQRLDGAGNPDPNGIVEFVVGTGGHAIQSFVRTDNRLAIGFDTASSSYGALKLALNDGGAGYQYVNMQGAVLDAGVVICTCLLYTSPSPRD